MTAEGRVSPMPRRSAVIEALSWHEDLERGRWGVEYATEVVEHLEAQARAVVLASPIRQHHKGTWQVDRERSCACECPACWNGDQCLCAECKDDHHDHLIAPARTSVSGDPS